MTMDMLRVMALLEATQTFEKKLNLALMYTGLRIPQFRVMLFLEKSGKITVSDLSRYLKVTRATVSVLVNQLLKAKIVDSYPNSEDKRSFYIKLTEAGSSRLSLAKSEVLLVEKQISNNLSSEMIANLNMFSNTMLSDC